MADAVEAAVGAVSAAQHGQAVECGTLGWASVVVDGTKRKAGHGPTARRHRHHGGQDESQAVCHIFVGGTGQGRCVTWDGAIYDICIRINTQYTFQEIQKLG